MALEELQNKYLKGITIVLSDSPKDKREGWFDVQDNMVVINVGHPLHRKFEHSVNILQYHHARVIASVLVQLAFKKKSMTVQEATELQTEFLIKMMDRLWL